MTPHHHSKIKKIVLHNFNPYYENKFTKIMLKHFIHNSMSELKLTSITNFFHWNKYFKLTKLLEYC